MVQIAPKRETPSRIPFAERIRYEDERLSTAVTTIKDLVSDGIIRKDLEVLGATQIAELTGNVMRTLVKKLSYGTEKGGNTELQIRPINIEQIAQADAFLRERSTGNVIFYVRHGEQHNPPEPNNPKKKKHTKVQQMQPPLNTTDKLTTSSLIEAVGKGIIDEWLTRRHGIQIQYESSGNLRAAQGAVALTLVRHALGGNTPLRHDAIHDCIDYRTDVTPIPGINNDTESSAYGTVPWDEKAIDDATGKPGTYKRITRDMQTMIGLDVDMPSKSGKREAIVVVGHTQQIAALRKEINPTGDYNERLGFFDTYIITDGADVDPTTHGVTPRPGRHEAFVMRTFEKTPTLTATAKKKPIEHPKVIEDIPTPDEIAAANLLLRAGDEATAYFNAHRGESIPFSSLGADRPEEHWSATLRLDGTTNLTSNGISYFPLPIGSIGRRFDIRRPGQNFMRMGMYDVDGQRFTNATDLARTLKERGTMNLLHHLFVMQKVGAIHSTELVEEAVRIQRLLTKKQGNTPDLFYPVYHGETGQLVHIQIQGLTATDTDITELLAEPVMIRDLANFDIDLTLPRLNRLVIRGLYPPDITFDWDRPVTFDDPARGGATVWEPNFFRVYQPSQYQQRLVTKAQNMATSLNPQTAASLRDTLSHVAEIQSDITSYPDYFLSADQRKRDFPNQVRSAVRMIRELGVTNETEAQLLQQVGACLLPFLSPREQRRELRRNMPQGILIPDDTQEELTVFDESFVERRPPEEIAYRYILSHPEIRIIANSPEERERLLRYLARPGLDALIARGTLPLDHIRLFRIQRAEGNDTPKGVRDVREENQSQTTPTKTRYWLIWE